MKPEKEQELSNIVNSEVYSNKEVDESNHVSKSRSIKLRNTKLSKRISNFEKIVIIERGNFEKERKSFEEKVAELSLNIFNLENKVE